MADRFFRYAAVGAVATAAHYAILVGLVEAGWLAPARAAAVGAWLRFQITAVIGAAISFSIVFVGTRIGVHYLIAQVVATLVSLVVTFEINRRWSFASPTPGRS